LALVVWIIAAIGLAVLAFHVANPASGHLDRPLSGSIQARLAAHDRLLSVAANLGSPQAVAGGAVLLAALCLIVRRPAAAIFSLAAAPAAGAITELVLKPLVHREGVASLLFPSGHTTGAFALAMTVAVLLLPHEETALLPAAGRILTALLALAAAAVVAIAVVALGWHYVTDALGGVVTAIVVVLAVAAGIDAYPWQQAASRRKTDAATTRPAGSPPRA
jgi:membrane-associated phospholipid phosphatase